MQSDPKRSGGLEGTPRREGTSLAYCVISLCVLGGAVALDRCLPVREARSVIIHSDDAGMYPCVNAATADAIEKGSVSSCSILVPCPAFEAFARYAQGHPEKDFGVHLTLNSETRTDRWGPVLPRDRVPTLVDAQGFLWSGTRNTVRYAKIDEVESELRAQIDRAVQSGIRISHLDHHMFVLTKRVDFLRLYVRLGLEYGLPIRYSVAMPAADDLDPNDTGLVSAYREGLEKLRARHMPVFADIDTDNYKVAPDAKRAYYLNLFRKLRPGVSEILIHCAYDAVGQPHPPAVRRREADTRVFMSQEIADALRREGIKVLTWRSFREAEVSRK
jgi:chitin disaccharide deacetylase